MTNKQHAAFSFALAVLNIITAIGWLYLNKLDRLSSVLKEDA